MTKYIDLSFKSLLYDMHNFCLSPILKSLVCSAAKRAEIDDAARLNSETHVTDTVKTVEVRPS